MKPLKSQKILATAGVAAGLFLLAILLQDLGGAYDSEFGGHPDEAAHFITGLMVRDYLLGGLPENPMRFAENYYAHYPKVALGHYPPGFYALEGAWLSVFPVSRISALMLMATLCAAFGLLAYRIARNVVGGLASVLVAVLCVVLPLTQTMTQTVMSDLALAVAVLLAACSFARFLETENWRHSLAFGLWASAATMVKGSGLFLALLPPLAILLTRRFALVKKPSLWVAVLPVAIICGPWMLYSRGITAEGMIEDTPLEHLKNALPYFGSEFLRVFGLALLVPAALGAWRAVKSPASPMWAILLSLPIALVVFYSAIPAGLEPRYLVPVVPAVLILAVAGIDWLPTRTSIIAGALVIVAFAFETFRIPQKNFAGFEDAAEALLTETPGTFLVSSDPRGEGAFIAEVAMRDPERPSHTIARGTKVLSTSDWLYRGYVLSFPDDADLLKYLEMSAYDGIVVDRNIPDHLRKPHNEQIARVLGSENARKSTARRPRRSDGEISIHRD